MSKGVAGGLQRLMHFFLPKEEDFFEIFATMSRQAAEGAVVLRQLYAGGLDPASAVEQIATLEHAVDQERHEAVKRLNETFVTPIMFDRQDILDLGNRLDDVVDFTRAAIDRTALYQVREMQPTALALADVLQRCTAKLAELCAGLAKLRSAEHEAIAQINTLENEGDRVVKEGLAELFNGGHDPLEVFKWHEIYGYIEEAIDHCEDTATVIEAALVKNS
ncbi:MAG: DUF47 family protein [Fimbriimonadaceae bacterium]|nr:DUF47 family protein [Fimbriimonadaceae bacterium]